MLEGLLEVIFEALGEVLLQIFAEAACELGLQSLSHSLRRRRSANPYLAGIGLCILGVIAGFVSSLVIMHRLLPPAKFPGISLVLAPLTTGLLMQVFGSWRRRRGGEPSYLATFWGGGIFAFAMAFVRWYMVVKLIPTWV